MKKLLLTILFFSPFVTHAVALTTYSPAPSVLSQFFSKIYRCTWHISCYRTGLVGTSLTTLDGTTLVSDFPTLYNANNTALNNGKIENATTSLPAIISLANLSTVGTIGAGIWNGTPVTAAYGGTGSTTLASNYVLLGNGTGIVKTATGIGTSGQFLTSQGAGLPPQWTTSAIDQTASYNWTGTYFGIQNLYASSTAAHPLVLNTVSLNTPSSLGNVATSSITVDSSGNIKYPSGNNKIAVFPSGISISSNNASTTVWSVIIPANELQSSNALHIVTRISRLAVTGSQTVAFGLTMGSTGNTDLGYVKTTAGASGADTANGNIDVWIMANNSTSAQVSSFQVVSSAPLLNPSTTATDMVNIGKTATGAFDTTSAQTLTLTVKMGNSGANDAITTTFTTVEPIKN